MKNFDFIPLVGVDHTIDIQEIVIFLYQYDVSDEQFEEVLCDMIKIAETNARIRYQDRKPVVIGNDLAFASYNFVGNGEDGIPKYEVYANVEVYIECPSL